MNRNDAFTRYFHDFASRRRRRSARRIGAGLPEVPPASAPAGFSRRNALRGRPAASQLESPRLPHSRAASALRSEQLLARGGVRRMALGAGVGALRLPLPAGDPPGGTVAARAGHFALAGGLGGGAAVALAEQPLSGRRGGWRLCRAGEVSPLLRGVLPAASLRRRQRRALHAAGVDPLPPLHLERSRRHHVAQHRDAPDRRADRQLRRELSRRAGQHRNLRRLPHPLPRAGTAGDARSSAPSHADDARRPPANRAVRTGPPELVPGAGAGGHLPAAQRLARRGAGGARRLPRPQLPGAAARAETGADRLAGERGAGAVPLDPSGERLLPVRRRPADRPDRTADADRLDRFRRYAPRRRPSRRDQQRALFLRRRETASQI